MLQLLWSVLVDIASIYVMMAKNPKDRREDWINKEGTRRMWQNWQKNWKENRRRKNGKLDGKSERMTNFISLSQAPSQNALCRQCQMIQPLQDATDGCASVRGASFAYVVKTKCPHKDSKPWNHLHYGEQNTANAPHKENSSINILNNDLAKILTMQKDFCEVKE